MVDSGGNIGVQVNVQYYKYGPKGRLCNDDLPSLCRFFLKLLPFGFRAAVLLWKIGFKHSLHVCFKE